MIQEIQAKVILSPVKQPDPWFGLRYTMNLYRGCQHQCIYCDSRSECYRIEDFNQILIKANAVQLLEKELAHKRIKGTIGTGSMNDCYMPIEAERKLTRQAMEVIAHKHFPVHVLTKSPLVLRDMDLFQEISQVYAALSFTITAGEDDLARKVEPGAPPTSKRLDAIRQLAAANLYCGVLLMPVLPFIEDNQENILSIVRQSHEAGAAYIIASFGMTLRDRQRTYYYQKLDELFPGLREKYEHRFGGRYSAAADAAYRLKNIFVETCARYNMPTQITAYKPVQAYQPVLFQ